MNDRLQENLRHARANLLMTQEWLRQARLLRTDRSHAERSFLQCLDRAWDAQCMANPGLQ